MTVENRNTQENETTPVTLPPTQIPYGLAWE
jgi:hypothetical protein